MADDKILASFERYFEEEYELAPKRMSILKIIIRKIDFTTFFHKTSTYKVVFRILPLIWRYRFGADSGPEIIRESNAKEIFFISPSLN